ncbi:403_t:CDS:2 [Ambispora leptoticha]|uniref:403_t:CDS:1 n=1 Tax=Ambispora leptoticha TaxID=144679 RepID=A0A9N9GBS1_9GLOM|nr:403_t:CDS:2 [Ambispora leptoticha]
MPSNDDGTPMSLKQLITEFNTRLQNELKEKEQTLLQQINDSLQLGLKTEELTRLAQEVTDLKAALNEKDKAFKRDLIAFIKMELGGLETLFPNSVDSHIRQKILKAADYQQLFTVKQEFLANSLKQLTAQTPATSSPRLSSTEKN